jgi:hypothetical protein
MVCLRIISVDTLHKGDTEDDNNNNNNNNICLFTSSINNISSSSSSSSSNIARAITATVACNLLIPVATHSGVCTCPHHRLQPQRHNVKVADMFAAELQFL